jgi:hypothetical protein
MAKKESKSKKVADELMETVGEELKSMLTEQDGSVVLTQTQKMNAIAQSMAWIKLSDARNNSWGKMFQQGKEAEDDDLGPPLLAEPDEEDPFDTESEDGDGSSDDESGDGVVEDAGSGDGE